LIGAAARLLTARYDASSAYTIAYKIHGGASRDPSFGRVGRHQPLGQRKQRNRKSRRENLIPKSRWYSKRRQPLDRDIVWNWCNSIRNFDQAERFTNVSGSRIRQSRSLAEQHLRGGFDVEARADDDAGPQRERHGAGQADTRGGSCRRRRLG